MKSLKATSYNRGPSLELASLMQTDIAQTVLRLLASTQDRVRICRSVSKECRELVDSQVHRLKASLQSISTHDAAQALPLHFPRLESLSFERTSTADSSRLLLHLVTHQPQLLAKLKELDLSNCQGLEAVALDAVLKACGSSLRHLTLPCLAASVTSSRRDFMKVISAHGTSLQHLQGAGDYIDADSITLLPLLSQLQSLDLSPGKHNVVLAPASLRPLASLCQLRSLQLGNHLAQYDTCNLAASLPALESLAFTYVDEYGATAQDFAPLRHSRTLKRLMLCGVPCNDQLLQVLAETPVKDLSLHACIFAGSAKAAALLNGRLERLQLRVSDKDMSCFAAALPLLGSCLTSLSLSVHRAAEDCSQLLRAVFSLPKLQELSLESHYHGLTEQELQDLPLQPHLSSLSLCNHFTDATLRCLTRITPGLRQLQLRSCGEVGDLGLGSVLSHCGGLREAKLVLMRGATAAGVAALASGPCMSSIVLEGCRNVTAEECRELMRLLNKPDLDIIKLR